jgi:hypothetical protein
MRIGLLALDERPVNTRYPAMLAEIAGVELMQPELRLLSQRCQPADTAVLVAWLREQADRLDVVIVATVMLGYGGLIASRTTLDPVADVITRLAALRELKQARPDLAVLAFDLIMRTSRADDNFEEPLYWAEYGSRMYRYSQLLDRQLQGQSVTDEVQALEAELPPEHVQDFLRRRLRNHTVNLSLLEMAADGTLDLLVISSDDTSEYGLGSREMRWVSEWVERTPGTRSRVLMYPGADEVGCALLARAFWQGRAPHFVFRYAIPGDEEVTAPFEDGPVRITLDRQVRAVGGVVVDDLATADFVVAVNTPSRRHPISYSEYNAVEAEHRTPYLSAFAQRIQSWLDDGRRVIVTDVAYSNGADPVLVEQLFQYVDVTRLAAYGAWNTAGNTIGVALAHGLAASRARTPAQLQAQQRFLTHRFLEDWGYQYAVRAEVSAAYRQQYGTSTIDPAHFEQVKRDIEMGLQQRLAQIPGLGSQWRLVNGSIRLPWDRFFEIDFDLEPVGGA